MLGATAINKVVLMGRLTADPELKQTNSNISVCRFTVAVTRAYKEADGTYKSDFISCIAWRTTAEFICRNFSKGKLILIEGCIQTGSYNDRTHPDVTHYTTDILVEQVAFGQTKGDSTGSGQQSAGTQMPSPNKQQTAQQPQPQMVSALDDFEEVVTDAPDLPF